MARVYSELEPEDIEIVQELTATGDSKIIYKDGSGNITGLTVGTNLSVAGGALNASGGGGGGSLTPTALKTSNYTASVSDYVICDISSSSFTVTLPTAPDDKSVIQILIVKTAADKVLTIQAGGTDKFDRTDGPQTIYMYLAIESLVCTYQSSTGLWFLQSAAAPFNFATGFPGIDSMTPITNADITIDASTRVLTVNPSRGYFDFFVDGGGKITRLRKNGAVNFPAFTDTSGTWFFYFNSSGTAVTTQTPWTTTDFPTIAPVYRIVWNKDLFSFTVTAATATAGDTYTNNGSTFTVLESISGGTTLICKRTSGTNNPSASGNLVRATGAGTDPIVFSAFSESPKLVAQYIEYHLNDISADDHQWYHLQGTQWITGGAMANNAITSGSPNADGRNSVIALSTISNVDDNLEYTVTSSPSGNPWQQDLGNTTPASLNATNSALFKIFTQDSSSRVYFLPATRYPFAWNPTTNAPQYITSTGVRTTVTNTDFFVYFVYATQNPVSGEAIKIVSATQEFTSLTNARAYVWADIQNAYSIIANDPEIRPLYRLIFEYKTSYDAGAKYSALRETQDLRKAAVTSTTVSTGSIPASSVTVVQSGNLGSNAQTSLENLDAVKANKDGSNWAFSSQAAGDIAYASSATAYTRLAKGSDGQVLTLASGVPSWAAASGGSSFWTAVAGSPTRASNTTFTVTGDYTSLFAKGMILKWTESSTVRYGMVSIPSTYSAPDTTVTLVGNVMASIDSSSLKYCLIGAEPFIANFAIAGTIGATGTDVANSYVAMEPMVVFGADMFVGTVAANSGNTVIDINSGGSTMFTNKPTLAYNSLYLSTPQTADTAKTLALGDRVTIDIDTVTSTTFPTDLYVKLYLMPTRYANL